MSSPDHRQRVSEIFVEALRLPADQRAAHVCVACGNDKSLFADVIRLLAFDAESRGLVQRSITHHPRSPESQRILSRFKRTAPDTPTPAPGLEAGQVVGDFRLISLIGQGGMGQVWEAEQVSLQRKVAIKFVRPDRITKKQLSYFEREARAGGRLSHPGIVAIHGFGENDGIAWIAMELVEGCLTVRDFVDAAAQAGEVPGGYDRQIAGFIAKLTDALQAAHDVGVIHRDIKPQNILIAPDESPKVTDFGLARIMDEPALSQSGDVAGSYYYMSPEQVSAQGNGIDHRTDIFSLGVVMYEMLALRRPFEGDTAHQVAQQILSRDPPDVRTVRSQIPRDLAVICGCALEKDQNRRYPSMAAFAQDIERHLSSRPILAQPPTRRERLVKWTKRHPTRSVASGLVVLAFSVISALGLRLASSNKALGEKTDRLTAANAELERKTERLTTANTDLEVKTREAERRTADVLRLSLAQEYEDLLSEVDALWPPYPDRIQEYEAWIRRAEAIGAEIQGLIVKRDELRRLALPLSPDQERADRESHPDLAQLNRLRGRLECQQRALAQRQGKRATKTPSVDWDTVPSDATGLAARARALVKPGRTSFGDEARGVALGERALDMASDGERAEIAAILSQAYFSVGRDDDALGMAFMAMEQSRGDRRARYELALAQLEAQVEGARSRAGLADAAEEIRDLEGQVAELQVRVGERRTWAFSDEAERETRARWWHNQLTALISELESLSEPGVGLLSEHGVTSEYGWSVPRRLAFARLLQAHLAPEGRFEQRWKAALPAINETYPGLNLRPQMGLVPLGADATSGLWEFWHVQSGEEPIRGRNGEWEIKEQTGLILVLLPGGRFWMGAQARDPGGHNYDPHANGNEEPVHEVQLSAFFLSSYEFTQAQWARISGETPSRWRPETDRSWSSGEHPVEQVSWLECTSFLPRMGLQLPSEAQWEYGCRAGTASPQPFASEQFVRYANIADIAYRDGLTATRANEAWDDGMGKHAPVGSFLPNAFGLHDVIGNVREWCQDGYDGDFYEVSPLIDPVGSIGETRARVYRGGSFGDPALSARSADRFYDPPYIAGSALGVRPARGIDP